MRSLIFLFILFAASPSFAAPTPVVFPTSISNTASLVTRFTARAPSGIKNRFWELVARIPQVFEKKRVDHEDIFLARALEDPVFISVRGTAPSLVARAPLIPFDTETRSTGSIGRQILDIAHRIHREPNDERDEHFERALIEHIESTFAARAPEERRRLIEDLSMVTRSLGALD